MCGGMKSGELTLYTDMHYMDLKRPGAWHELPQYPGPVFLNLQLVVHGNKAYSFNGKPHVLVFDLVTERWGRMQTSWVDHSGKPAPWPQEIDGLSDYAMHVANGKIYVFGGTVDKAKMGCNFLAVLDLATKTWRHLSGFARIPPADYDTPGPRKYVASWVDGKGEKIYLLQGMADRAASEMLHQAHAARDSHGYDDFWSWDIKARKWRRERMVGNTPCPRTEMACTYVRPPRAFRTPRSPRPSASHRTRCWTAPSCTAGTILRSRRSSSPGNASASRTMRTRSCSTTPRRARAGGTSCTRASRRTAHRAR